MSMFDNLKEQAGQAGGAHGDKLEQLSDQGLDRASDMAQDRGLGAEHVEKGRDMLDERIGDQVGEDENPA